MVEPDGFCGAILKGLGGMLNETLPCDPGDPRQAEPRHVVLFGLRWASFGEPAPSLYVDPRWSARQLAAAVTAGSAAASEMGGPFCRIAARGVSRRL